MNTEDRELLLTLVTRIGMFIHPITSDSAINFVYGYEMGTRGNCDFTNNLRQLLTEKYKVSYSNDGWPGQVKRLAKKRSSTWLITFRTLTVEIITMEEGGRLSEQHQAILKSRIASIISNSQLNSPQQLSSYSIEDWLSLCDMKSTWFKMLWSKQEWVVIKKLNDQIQEMSKDERAAKSLVE